MKEDCARSILRLVAVITVLVGASLSTVTCVSLIGASTAMQGAPAGVQVKMTGMVGVMGGYAVLSYALVAAWGVLLYFSSPKLAERIVE